MTRTIWFVAGAATSAYALVKARRMAEAVTPDGIADRLAGLTLGARLLREEVRTNMVVRETELRERLGLLPDGTPELEPANRAPLELSREGST